MMGNQMRTNDSRNGDERARGVHKQCECGHSIWLCNWKHWNDKCDEKWMREKYRHRHRQRKESEKDYWISSWTILKSNCEATVANGMSNLSAHYIITKRVPWSSHENLIMQYLNWHTTYFSHLLAIPTQFVIRIWCRPSHLLAIHDLSSFSAFLRI